MITEQQYKEAASIIGCAVSAIKAVYFVETAGKGYLKDGRVEILFEGHRFWKQLVAAKINPAAVIGYENVLYQKWTKKHYKGGTKEWDRMSKAIELCHKLGVSPEAALDSASYGAFQIMGENSKMCGYETAHEMVAAFNNGGEAEQLRAFVRFVKAKKLDDELKNKNWAGFALGFNGTQYRENNYDTRLAAADKKYSLSA